MANIYYYYSTNRGSGILRAVLTSEEGKSLLNAISAQYLGNAFPVGCQEPGPDFAILRIFEDEKNQNWQTGFYRFDVNIMRIEEAVVCLQEVPPPANLLTSKESKVPSHLKSSGLQLYPGTLPH